MFLSMVACIPIGLESLHRLESLSLAHNFLTHDAVDVLASLTSLKRIDLSHNLLNKVPEVLYSVIKLVQMAAVVKFDHASLQFRSFAAG